MRDAKMSLYTAHVGSTTAGAAAATTKTYSIAHRIHCESKRVYISCEAVALSAQNFRRHVDGSSHHRHRCIGVDHAGGAVVSDLCLVSTHRADEYVFGFDITMDNRNGVEVENSRRGLLW